MGYLTSCMSHEAFEIQLKPCKMALFLVQYSFVCEEFWFVHFFSQLPGLDRWISNLAIIDCI